MKQLILKIYLCYFNFVISKRKNQDLPDRYIHAHLVSVLTTGLLMWAYALLALISFQNHIPGIVGVVASTIHFLSPLLYWRSNNYLLNSSVFIGAGLIHQMTFAYYTGGFDSNILIWLGILPMLAGLTAGRIGAILWALITSVCVLGFLILKLNNYQFPFLITDNGMLVGQCLILFGWIFISTVVIWVYVFLTEDNLNKLENSKQRTQNLLNIFSHDISTPLMVIAGKLNQLMKTPLSEVQLSYAAKAYKATERLGQITETIRDLRLNEVNKKELVFSLVDVREMVLELKEIFSERLEQKKILFNWSVSSEIIEYSTCRSLLLNQILGNLLSNAIKFSEPGSEIRLRVAKMENCVQFLIEDNGTGIPQEMRGNVFEANSSKSNLGTDGEVGTGFGLPIVKGCIDRLGGKISFTSKTSQEGASGTCFRLLFPV